MAFILTNVRLFAIGADLTGSSNKAELSAEVEDKDTTNYASGGHVELIGGLASSEISAEGQWEAGDPGLVDDASWSQLGGLGPWTLAPEGAAVGALAYFTRALRSSYTLGGSVGDVAPWTGTAKGSWPLVRGVIEHPPGTVRSADGTSAGVELGAVAAGQRLYAALHVLSASGTSPSLTLTIESDADNTFASPTTQLTFDAATAEGGQVLRTDGSAITDTWVRANWTITGTTPGFFFVLALGIA
jgi:hypothetical protein